VPRRIFDMAGFWDERAREDAFFFVDNELEYGEPDAERFWARGERVIDAMLSELGVELRPTDEVLDIGCGLGRLTRVLAARAGRVVALDVSAEMLRRARELSPHLDNVEWVHGDGRTLHPLPDDSLDAVVSFVVFQHLPDPELTLGYVAEMGRVLRPGGWAAFQVSTDPSVHEPRTSAGNRLRAVAGRAPKGQTDPRWLGSAVTLDALDATAVQAGLELERIANPGEQFCLVAARATASRGA